MLTMNVQTETVKNGWKDVTHTVTFEAEGEQFEVVVDHDENENVAEFTVGGLVYASAHGFYLDMQPESLRTEAVEFVSDADDDVIEKIVKHVDDVVRQFAERNGII